MSKKSSPLVLNKSERLFSPTVHGNYSHSHHPSEIRVCGDCQKKHSRQVSNQTDPGFKRNEMAYQHRGPSNKDDLNYLSLLSQDGPWVSNKSEYEENIENNAKGHIKSVMTATSHDGRNSYQDKRVTVTNQSRSPETTSVVKVNELLNRHPKSKSLSIQGGNRKLTGSESQGIFATFSNMEFQEVDEKKDWNFEPEEEVGEEKFVDYAKDFASELDKVSMKLESNIRKNFENATHSILHQHVNRQSLIEKDETYRSRESKDYTSREKREISFQPDSPIRMTENIKTDYNRTEKTDKSYISASYIGNTEAREISSSPLQWDNKAVTLPASAERWAGLNNQIDMKGNKNSIDRISQEGSPSYRKHKGFDDSKNRSISQTSFQGQILLRDESIAKDYQSTIEHVTDHTEESAGLRKLNQKLRTRTQPVFKQERYLLSPPEKDEDKSHGWYKTLGGHEISQRNETAKSLGESLQPIKHELKYEGFSVANNNKNNVRIEQKIAEYEEVAIQLIKQNRCDEALDCLEEADLLIRNELATYHPQQIYIHYLLGECYVKKEDYSKAEKILGNAIEKYEANGNKYEKDNKLLQSQVNMTTRQFSKALDVYKKLIKEAEAHNLNEESKEDIKGTIPHIVLLKYNMAECLRCLDKLNQADLVFYEVLTQFDLKNEEQLEKYYLLVNIAEYFKDRQQRELSIEASKKLCQIAKNKPEFESTEPDLFITIYDEVASGLYTRGEYLESTKYYELSFKLKVKVYGMKHPKVGYALLALGKAYHLAKEYQKALQRLSTGLDIIESFEGRSSAYSANVNLTMAKIYYSLKDYRKSITLYERSLDTYSQLLGSSHPNCLRIYANLVFVCFEFDNIQKVMEIAERALKAVEEAHNPEVFAMLNEIGNLYRKNDFPQEAVQFYSTALKKFSNQNQSHISPEAVNLVYMNMGSANFHLRKFGDALQYYKEAGKYFGEINNGVNPQIISIYINIIRIYRALGKNSDAGQYSKKALTALSFLEKEVKDQAQQEVVMKLRNDLKILKNNSII